MDASPALLEFIKGWEGCKLIPYLDTAGHWTVGYGHKLASDLSGEITQAQADALLADDVAATCRGLAMRVVSEPSQQQWDAVVSLAFNEGVRAIANSTLMAHFNRDEWPQASYQFPKWCYAKDAATGETAVLTALLKRRLAEQRIFDVGDYSGRP